MNFERSVSLVIIQNTFLLRIIRFFEKSMHDLPRNLTKKPPFGKILTFYDKKKTFSFTNSWIPISNTRNCIFCFVFFNVDGFPKRIWKKLKYYSRWCIKKDTNSSTLLESIIYKASMFGTFGFIIKNPIYPNVFKIIFAEKSMIFFKIFISLIFNVDIFIVKRLNALTLIINIPSLLNAKECLKTNRNFC